MAHDFFLEVSEGWRLPLLLVGPLPPESRSLPPPMWSSRPRARNHSRSEDTVRVTAATKAQARLPRELAGLPEPTRALTSDAPFNGGLKPCTNV